MIDTQRLDWRKLTDSYWLKEINAPFGTLTCELLMTAESGGYVSRVTIPATDPNSSGEVLELLDPLPLVEAQAECDKLASLAMNGPLSWSVSIPLMSLNEENNG